MAWNNGPLTVYHATIGLSANDIEQRGVDLTKCRLGTDFDQGFYTTGIRNQANLFANQKYQDEILKYNRRPLPHPLHAAVVEFSLDRGTLGRLRLMHEHPVRLNVVYKTGTPRYGHHLSR